MDPQNYAARQPYRPPAAWYRRLNPIGVPLTSLGLAPRDAVTLVVRGRKTGKLQRIPILRIPYQDQDYLVALAGEAQWVRNVRAAAGAALIRRRGTRRVHLEELPVGERAAVIAEYVRQGRERSGPESGAKQARYYFGLDSEPTPADVEAVAAYYPVFRISYLT